MVGQFDCGMVLELVVKYQDIVYKGILCDNYQGFLVWCIWVCYNLERFWIRFGVVYYKFIVVMLLMVGIILCVVLYLMWGFFVIDVCLVLYLFG